MAGVRSRPASPCSSTLRRAFASTVPFAFAFRQAHQAEPQVPVRARLARASLPRLGPVDLGAPGHDQLQGLGRGPVARALSASRAMALPASVRP